MTVNEQLSVSSSPHIVTKNDTRRVMLDVLIALSPAVIASVIFYGWRALVLTVVCVAACNLFEFGFTKLVRRPTTVFDLSASVTGVLLSQNLSASLPIWMAVVGCFFAIVVVKQLFGGIGKNFANPAIAARIMLFLCFATEMNSFAVLKGGELVSEATPFTLSLTGAERLSYWKMFLGFHAGAIGETCSLALLIGLVYLLVRRVISWHIPVSFVGTVALLSWIAGADPLEQVLSGGLLIGAIFMATDYVTSPASPTGRLIFGVGCGAITTLIRLAGHTEGVSYAILMMTLLCPYIDKLTLRRPVGAPKPQKPEKAGKEGTAK
ncbi:MAG: RnfABCDGE type electron transport complex subunit D [Clostridia bacterium]|nr:RnfABCDGE type electron transport complex subunit D [Clostridia bacterium]